MVSAWTSGVGAQAHQSREGTYKVKLVIAYYVADFITWEDILYLLQSMNAAAGYLKERIQNN